MAIRGFLLLWFVEQGPGEKGLGTRHHASVSCRYGTAVGREVQNTYSLPNRNDELNTLLLLVST
jgi:hypothetical protein